MIDVGNTPIITLDVDWAPDWMIDSAASTLRAAGVRATWFATHSSAALDAVRNEEELFDVGIHPNFGPASTHGASVDEVLECMLSLYPEAVCSRSHSLHQSERILETMVDRFGMRADCSIFLKDTPNVRPHALSYVSGGRPLLRVPHIYQDNMSMITDPHPSPEDPTFVTPGLKVFNFHPVHIALNSVTMRAYDTLKATTGLQGATPQYVASIRDTRRGVGDLFDDLVSKLGSREATFNIRDLLQ